MSIFQVMQCQKYCLFVRINCDLGRCRFSPMFQFVYQSSKYYFSIEITKDMILVFHFVTQYHTNIFFFWKSRTFFIFEIDHWWKFTYIHWYYQTVNQSRHLWSYLRNSRLHFPRHICGWNIKPYIMHHIDW